VIGPGDGWVKLPRSWVSWDHPTEPSQATLKGESPKTRQFEALVDSEGAVAVGSYPAIAHSFLHPRRVSLPLYDLWVGKARLHGGAWHSPERHEKLAVRRSLGAGDRFVSPAGLR